MVTEKQCKGHENWLYQWDSKTIIYFFVQIKIKGYRCHNREAIRQGTMLG